MGLNTKIGKLVVKVGTKVGMKAVNSDCDYYLYNEPLTKNLKKHLSNEKKEQK